MATPEKKVKDKVVKILKDVGAYYFYPVASGYGSVGIPDLVACIDGKFIGIECKAGKGKPTALQEKNLADICKTGGVAILVNEHGLSVLETFLKIAMPTEGMLIDLLKGVENE